MAEFGKIIEAAKIPAIVVIVLGLVNWGLIFTMGFLGAGILGSLVGVLGLLVTIWAGYNAVKAFKFDLVGAGLVGAVVSIASGIVGFVLSLIFLPMVMASAGEIGMAIGTGAAVVGAVIGIPIGAVIGFVLALIGGFVGQKF